MKRFILPMAIIALMSTACDSKTELKNEEVITEPQSELMPVSLNIDGVQTRSTTENKNEARIENLQVFIFHTDAEGNEIYDSYYSFNDINADNLIFIDPNCGAVSYRIAVYANHNSTINFDGDVLQDQALFANEAQTRFQMYGYAEGAPSEIFKDNSVNITLSRQCSKVSVKEIAVKWTNSANSLKSFKLKGIYLMDVPSVLQNHSPLAENTLTTQSGWYNTLGHTSSAHDSMLYDRINSQSVTERTSYTTDHYFYGYISTIDEFYTDGSWKPSGTRLVIEAELGGESCYYPIALSKLVTGQNTGDFIKNKAFTFNKITITKPGASTPYGELKVEEALNFSISVEAWNEIVEDNYTIQ